MRTAWRAALFAVALFFLYFYGLADAGLIGPDEPRYASIGREMAQRGDWVTPRLWGEPWFEKPALEYWGIALAYRLGFGDDWAPRIFNAGLSIAFLGYFGWVLRRLYSPEIAFAATAILATSIGWVAESRTAVMDLPLAASFGAAMVTALAGWLPLAGVFLGVAMLAKGLVPLVLALPAVWFFRKDVRGLAAAALGCVVVAGPWYAAMLLRHGSEFFNEFILKHHFSRFTETSLQHPQPVWFFVPVLLAGLFPWTPLVALLRIRKEDAFLWSWFGFGFLFFSLSSNKLPGYVLPLLPPLAILIAKAMRSSARAWAWFGGCGLLLGLTPLIAFTLPEALAHGLSRVSFSTAPIGPAILIAIGAAAVGMWRGFPVVLATAVVGYGLILARMDRFDYYASARPMWRAIAERKDQVCVESLHRAWQYGLNFYAGVPLVRCETELRPIRLRQQGSQPPEILLEPQTTSPGPVASPDPGAF